MFLVNMSAYLKAKKKKKTGFYHEYVLLYNWGPVKQCASLLIISLV